MKFDKIKSIIKVEDNADIYDVGVPFTHNYVAQGIYHHNSGKDHTSAKILAYIAYWLLCFKDVRQNFPGIGYNTPICFGNTSISGTEAKNIFFNDFKIILKNTRNPNTGQLWFEERGVDLRDGRDIQGREVIFPNNIHAYSLDSKKFTGIGKNLLVQVYDEIGAFPPENAQTLHSETRKTQKSRFPDTYKSILISYKHSDNDYMNISYEKGRKKLKVWSDKASTWEVNLARTKDDFADEYLEDPEGAERTYECKGGEVGQDTYIKFSSAIYNTIDFRRVSPIKKSKSRVWSFEDIDLFKWFRGIKGVQYHAHIDLAKGLEMGDCAGFGLGHMIKGYPIEYDKIVCDHLSKEGFNVRKIQDRKGEAVFMDLIFQMRAKGKKEIQFADFIRFLLYLKKIRGFNITYVTYDGWQCLVGETYIPLANGKKIKIKNLIDNYEKKWVYSYDIKTNKIVPGKILGAKYTGTKQIYKIILDNNKYIKCSGNHPFLLRNGKYIRADELIVGNSLMPLYRRFGKKKYNKWLEGYLQVYQSNAHNKWQYFHRTVVKEQSNFNIGRGYVVHHKDYNKFNNNPENLEILTNNEHNKKHGGLTKKLWKGKKYRKIFMKGIKKAANTRITSESYKNKVRKQMKKQWKDPLFRNHVSKKISNTVKKLWENKDYKKKQSEAHKGSSGYWLGKERADMQGVNNPRYNPSLHNHKIIKIEKLGKEKTYDIEIDKYHNFALSARIFVHNSVMSIQELNKRGIKSEILSVDRDTIGYDTYKSMIYKGLFNTYFNLIYLREAKELIRTKNNKVDHPVKSLQRAIQEHDERGSKDILDCVAAICRSLIEHKSEFNYWFSNVEMPKGQIKTPKEYEEEYYNKLQESGIQNVEELNERDDEDIEHLGHTYESKEKVKRGEIPTDLLDY